MLSSRARAGEENIAAPDPVMNLNIEICMKDDEQALRIENNPIMISPKMAVFLAPNMDASDPPMIWNGINPR